MNATADRLIEDYLATLRRAAQPLPADQRDELVGGIEEHIAEARRMGATSETAVRTLLDRIGSPQAIVAEACGEAVPPPAVAPTGRLEFAGVACLVLAELAAVTVLLLPFGLLLWMAGLVCVFISTAWTTKEKIRALAILGSGFLAAILVLAFGTVSVTVSDVCSQASTSAQPAPGARAPRVQPQNEGPTGSRPVPTRDCTDSGAGLGSTEQKIILVGFGLLLLTYLAAQVVTVRALLRARPQDTIRQTVTPQGAAGT